MEKQKTAVTLLLEEIRSRNIFVCPKIQENALMTEKLQIQGAYIDGFTNKKLTVPSDYYNQKYATDETD